MIISIYIRFDPWKVDRRRFTYFAKIILWMCSNNFVEHVNVVL